LSRNWNLAKAIIASIQKKRGDGGREKGAIMGGGGSKNLEPGGGEAKMKNKHHWHGNAKIMPPSFVVGKAHLSNSP